MPGYSRNQARLAAALVKGPKTAKELRDELNAPLNEVENDLGKLIKLKLVEKLGGYPTKYRAIEAVRRGVMSEKPIGDHLFRAHIIIEGQAKEKPALEKATKELIANMRADKVIAVSNVKEEDIIKEGESYTNLFEADIAANHLEDMVYAVLTYGPSSIELEPFREYTLKADEAQGVLMDVATVLQAYAATLVQKDLQMQERERQIQEYRKKSPEIFIK